MLPLTCARIARLACSGSTTRASPPTRRREADPAGKSACKFRSPPILLTLQELCSPFNCASAPILPTWRLPPTPAKLASLEIWPSETSPCTSRISLSLPTLPTWTRAAPMIARSPPTLPINTSAFALFCTLQSLPTLPACRCTTPLTVKSEPTFSNITLALPPPSTWQSLPILRQRSDSMPPRTSRSLPSVPSRAYCTFLRDRSLPIFSNSTSPTSEMVASLLISPCTRTVAARSTTRSPSISLNVTSSWISLNVTSPSASLIAICQICSTRTSPSISLAEMPTSKGTRSSRSSSHSPSINVVPSC